MTETSSVPEQKVKPFFLWRHLNKLRWISLSIVFAMLLLLPLISVYQNFLAAHAYDLLRPGEKTLYGAVEMITDTSILKPHLTSVQCNCSMDDSAFLSTK